ncbi:MAG: DUF5615 family PIN-like protein [Chloroflexi bacterium]|nr:DUF5615 family PIN-like protein [Chloroflexota bacterium]
MAAFYLDHNVSVQIAYRLQAAGHTVTTAHQLGLSRGRDEVHFLLAAQRGWTLITYNRKDFVLLHDAWLLWSASWGVTPTHAGVLVSAQRNTVPHDLMAAEIDSLVQSNAPLLNQLYEWRPASRWNRRDTG